MIDWARDELVRRGFAINGEAEECLPLALRLGRLCRAITWAGPVRVLPPEDREREMVPGWFQVFLESARG